MSQGTVGWWVIGLYLRSVGYFLTVIILMSMVLMQLSQNFTFLWLTFWVKNRPNNSTNVTDFIGVSDIPHEIENTTILDHGFTAVDSIIHSIVNRTLDMMNNFRENTTTVQPETMTSMSKPIDVQLAASVPVYTNDFYLEMYFALAGANLVFTIMRAFLFAYGGVKAAQRIHRILVKTIVRVSITVFNKQLWG